MSLPNNDPAPSLVEFLNARLAEDAEWAAEFEGSHILHRLMAEVEAKRRIIERHGGWHVCEDNGAGERWDDDRNDLVEAPCDDLRIIGAVYAGHPDYRQKWAA